MADMYYKDEFNELFTIKDRVKQALEESESSIRLSQSAAIDEGFEKLLTKFERSRSNLSLALSEVKYQSTPLSGDKNTLIVLTIINTIMAVEAKHILKTLREIQERVESGSAEVLTQLNAVASKILSLTAMFSEVKELSKGTIGKGTVKRVKKKYQKSIDKITDALEQSFKGSIGEELETYIPEKPSLWKRLLFFWRDHSPEADLPELILEFSRKAQRGEIPKSCTLNELEEWIKADRPAWKIKEKKLKDTIKKLSKKGQIPGWRDSPSGKILFLAV